jgi:phosphoenolpyruvate carboxykinase (ATP)
MMPKLKVTLFLVLIFQWSVDGVETTMLHPQKAWKDSSAYTSKAQELAASFHTQMKKFGDFYETNIKGAPTYNA